MALANSGVWGYFGGVKCSQKKYRWMTGKYENLKAAAASSKKLCWDPMVLRPIRLELVHQSLQALKWKFAVVLSWRHGQTYCVRRYASWHALSLAIYCCKWLHGPCSHLFVSICLQHELANSKLPLPDPCETVPLIFRFCSFIELLGARGAYRNTCPSTTTIPSVCLRL